MGKLYKLYQSYVYNQLQESRDFGIQLNKKKRVQEIKYKQNQNNKLINYLTDKDILDNYWNEQLEILKMDN